MAEQCLREVRTLSYLLHPPFLDERGLASALQWYVEGFMRRSNIEVHLDVASDVGRLPGDMELALFRIVQEGLTNIHQHSGSPVANLRVLREAHRVILTIADAGKGMPAEVVERMSTSGSPIGVGIAGMQERIRQLGGRLEIDSGDQGTTLTVTLPVAGADPSQRKEQH